MFFLPSNLTGFRSQAASLLGKCLKKVRDRALQELEISLKCTGQIIFFIFYMETT